MTIHAKRVFLLLLLSAGTVWNLLCILNILPPSLFTISVGFISACSLYSVLLPLIHHRPQRSEVSAYILDLTHQEKKMAGITLALACIWIISAGIYTVYHL